MKTLKNILLGLIILGVLAARCQAMLYVDGKTCPAMNSASSADGPNLYTYVKQNPWTKFDPQGLQGEAPSEANDANDADAKNDADFFTEMAKNANEPLPNPVKEIYDEDEVSRTGNDVIDAPDMGAAPPAKSTAATPAGPTQPLALSGMLTASPTLNPGSGLTTGTGLLADSGLTPGSGLSPSGTPAAEDADQSEDLGAVNTPPPPADPLGTSAKTTFEQSQAMTNGDGTGTNDGGIPTTTVIHFTDLATVAKIQNGTGMLNAGTFVTLPGEVEGMGASDVEDLLEIDPGKGVMSTTFETPTSNLGPAFNGPLTSGLKIQFQLIDPTAPGPFVPTPP
jgi:hypothetical protein